MRFFSAFPNDNLCCAAHASIWYFLRSNIFHVCHLNVLKSLFFSLIETLRHLTRFFGHFWNRWMPLNQRLCTWTGCYERHKIAFREQVSSRLLLYFINSWMSHQLQLLDLGVRWADWLVRQAEYLNGLRLLQWWRLGNIFFLLLISSKFQFQSLQKNLQTWIQLNNNFTYHKNSRLIHHCNLSPRYRTSRARCSFRHRRRGSRLGTKAHPWSTAASPYAPYFWTCNFSQHLSSRKFAFRYQNTNRLDSEWLADPKTDWRKKRNHM